MVNFSPLAVEIGLSVWGSPANFNGFRVFASLLRGSQLVDVSQTLRRWTEGATYVRQGAITLGISTHSSPRDALRHGQRAANKSGRSVW